jgi:hypothetical protein
MSIKYIQWDTLSHVLLPTVSRCCMVDAARRLVEEIHHYHETSARDHAEHIKMAVRCGNYGAALDMVSKLVLILFYYYRLLNTHRCSYRCRFGCASA